MNLFRRIRDCLLGKSSENQIPSEIVNPDRISKFNISSYVLSNTRNTFECTICLEDIKDGDYVSLTECFHIYHHRCLNGWLVINPICPICDKDL
jgi:hypothetical protein